QTLIQYPLASNTNWGLNNTRAFRLVERSMRNRLFYGDNLEVLRERIDDESVDLVYLDPPFNSNRNYNVLFREKSGVSAAAQLQAFEDTWRWDEAAVDAYEEMIQYGRPVV